jgi:hypothetical protein
MLKNLLYLVLLSSGVLFGLFLSKLCKEEIKNWRKRLIIISILSLVLSFIVFFIPITFYAYRVPTIMGLFFIIITFLTIVRKIN